MKGDKLLVFLEELLALPCWIASTCVERDEGGRLMLSEGGAILIIGLLSVVGMVLHAIITVG